MKEWVKVFTAPETLKIDFIIMMYNKFDTFTFPTLPAEGARWQSWIIDSTLPSEWGEFYESMPTFTALSETSIIDGNLKQLKIQTTRQFSIKHHEQAAKRAVFHAIHKNMNSLKYRCCGVHMYSAWFPQTSHVRRINSNKISSSRMNLYVWCYATSTSFVYLCRLELFLGNLSCLCHHNSNRTP